MYKEFFQLRERPFSKTPDPLYLYPSRSHREALARLLHAVEVGVVPNRARNRKRFLCGCEWPAAEAEEQNEN